MFGRRKTAIDVYDAIYCIICGRKSSNGDQAQSNRYTELQDAQKNEKRWVHVKFLSQKHDVAHLKARPYFGHHRKQVRFAHMRSKKRPPSARYGIDFMGINDVSHGF